MKRTLFALVPGILLCLLGLSCVNSARTQKMIQGRWNLVSIKLSRDLGETWQAFSPADYEWLEFAREGEFHKPDNEFGRTLNGEWRISRDSIYYIIPELSALPDNKCSGKIIQCDEKTLIIEETFRDGISKSYYIRE